MSRTYRRRGERRDYDWVLRDYRWVGGALVSFLIDPRSKDGRHAIARFHSDACWTLRSTAPRWYRRIVDSPRPQGIPISVLKGPIRFREVGLDGDCGGKI